MTAQLNFAAKGFEDGVAAYRALQADRFLEDGVANQDLGEYSPNSDWDAESWAGACKGLGFDPTAEQQVEYFEGYKNGWNSCR